MHSAAPFVFHDDLTGMSFKSEAMRPLAKNGSLKAGSFSFSIILAAIPAPRKISLIAAKRQWYVTLHNQVRGETRNYCSYMCPNGQTKACQNKKRIKEEWLRQVVIDKIVERLAPDEAAIAELAEETRQMVLEQQRLSKHESSSNLPQRHFWPFNPKSTPAKTRFTNKKTDSNLIWFEPVSGGGGDGITISYK